MLTNFEQIFAPSLTDKIRVTGRGELQVFCPFHSHSYKTPSMSVNQETGVWKCFSCGQGGGFVSYHAKVKGLTISQALRDLNEFDENYKTKPPIQLPKKEVKPDTDYTDYWWGVYENSILHEKNWSFYGQKLHELRGITYSTAVACGIGYDASKGWILPCFKYPKGECIGYEVRKKDFTKFKFKNGSETKCYKATNTPNCLSVVYAGWSNKKAYLMEGYMDSFKMYQYLHERNNGEQVQEAILTPSCGVATIEALLLENNLLSEFDEVIFVLDNDAPGREATEKISQLPHDGRFKFFSGIKEEGWDFEMLYDKKLTKNVV